MAQPSYPQLPTGLSQAADPPIVRVMDAGTQTAFANLCRWLRERLAQVLYALNRLLLGDTDGLQFSQRATEDDSPENGMLRYFDAAVLGTEGFWLREDGSWKKVPDVPGGAASIYWDKTATVVHPKLATDDVAIGDVDSGAPIFFDASEGDITISGALTATTDANSVIKGLKVTHDEDYGVIFEVETSFGGTPISLMKITRSSWQLTHDTMRGISQWANQWIAIENHASGYATAIVARRSRQ